MELETPDVAVVGAGDPRIGGVLGGWVAVEDGAGGRVRERPAARPGFD